MTKKIVHYDATKKSLIALGMSAIVKPIDHTSPLVSNEKLVVTSRVIAKSKCGKFETENTIYHPVKGDKHV